MGTALEKYSAKLAAMAKAYVESEDSGGVKNISTKSGRFSYDDTDLGTELILVMLDAVRENAYYGSKYDSRAEVHLPPVCFALGKSKSLTPHKTVVYSEEGGHFNPQAEECDVCPWNEYGSSDTGRGKACGNRRRLAVLHAGDIVPGTRKKAEEITIFDDPKDYQRGEIYTLRLPPTSIKSWAAYVKAVSAGYQRPPCAVVTRVSLVPNDKTQFSVEFSTVAEVEEDVLEAVLGRLDEASAILMEPYAPPTAEMLSKAAHATKGRSAVDGLRKRR